MNGIFSIKLMRVEDGRANELIAAWQKTYPKIIRRLIRAGIVLGANDVGVISATVAEGIYTAERYDAFFSFLSTEGIRHEFNANNISILVLAERIEEKKTLTESVCGQVLFGIAESVTHNVKETGQGLELDDETASIYVTPADELEDMIFLCIFPKGVLSIENLLLLIKRIFTLLA